MKIVHICPFFHPVIGGMERLVYETAKNQIALGHDVSVFTSDLSRRSRIDIKEEIIDGIKIRRFNTLFKIGEFASFFPSVFGAINKSGADIFHYYSYRHPLNFGVFFSNKPSILTALWPQYPKGLRNKVVDMSIPIFDWMFAKTILNRFDSIIALSETEASWLHKLGAKKTKVIPCGLNEEAYQKTGKIISNQIFSIGRIHPSKGFNQIVKIAPKFPNLNFIIAGKGKKPVNSPTNVKFIGQITDKEKTKYMRSADIYLNTSLHESFGIVVAEAMACGCAILSSDAGALPETLNGSGILYMSGNIESLTTQLNRLVYDEQLKKQIRIKARAQAEEYRWSKVIKQIEKLYKSLQ
ncbi:glycosyltransferase family 4 protein [Candidatus Woesearchaeota archaeon]|nr:glycosyltransferase family 4 protein [Candidatus Woesearchaeota archaeon]